MSKPKIETPLTPELCCTDIQVSVKFYVDVLGFTVQYQRPENGFAMLERQGSRIMLDQINPGINRSWISGVLEKPYGRGMNLQMVTTNVQELYELAKVWCFNLFAHGRKVVSRRQCLSRQQTIYRARPRWVSPALL